MGNLNRRDAVRAAGLAVVGLVGLVGTPALAQDKVTKEPSPLDAVLRVEITEKGYIALVFETPGTTDQTFDSSEVRYALLDSSGKQITSPLMQGINAFMHTAAALHRVSLPKGSKSVTETAEFDLDFRALKPGGEYYLVVSVRNLTALAKFKCP